MASDQVSTQPTELQPRRGSRAAWLAPAFFLLLLLTFIVAPGSAMDKFYTVCFGI